MLRNAREKQAGPIDNDPLQSPRRPAGSSPIECLLIRGGRPHTSVTYGRPLWTLWRALEFPDSGAGRRRFGGICSTITDPSRRSPNDPNIRFLKPFRQIIESVRQTIKAQLDLERDGGRKPQGLCACVLRRILALTASIWHNETTVATGHARSLLAYDH